MSYDCAVHTRPLPLEKDGQPLETLSRVEEEFVALVELELSFAMRR
jgi:hypothetical protein